MTIKPMTIKPATGKPETLRGSCLCGAITYEIDALDPNMAHCHCSMCRKFHGAAYATFASAKNADFRWTAGEDKLKSYTGHNGTIRRFCVDCGSSLTFEPSSGADGMVEIAIGSLDDAINQKPDAHIFTANKASWQDITDDLPAYPQGRDSIPVPR